MTATSSLTFNWPVVGNKHVVDFLQSGIAAGRVSHCYLFTGPAGVGKSAVAEHFISSLLCEHYVKKRGVLPCQECLSCRQVQKKRHSDVRFLAKPADKKNISVDQVREFIYNLSLGTFMGAHKIGIIADAHQLSNGGANALLKTLEEPSGRAIIILLTANQAGLPATIVSRAQVVRFMPVAFHDVYDYLVQTIGVGRDFARTAARLSMGRPDLAVRLSQDKSFFATVEAAMQAFLSMTHTASHESFGLIDELSKSNQLLPPREQALQILEWWQVALRDMFLVHAGVTEMTAHPVDSTQAALPLEKLFSLQRALERANEYVRAQVQPKLVLESVALV